MLHFTLRNVTDHQVKFFDLHYFLDVRDSDGNLAPETDWGRREHELVRRMAAFAGNGPHAGIQTARLETVTGNRLPEWKTIPVHKKIEFDHYATAEYVLGSGSYTVVAFVCAVKVEEGPKCFKSNTIPIRVVATPPATRLDCPQACEPDVVGILNREVADSQDLSVRLQPLSGPAKENSLIYVHLIFENRSDRDLLLNPSPALEVRDQDGELAPETANGRGAHFFSPCHTYNREMGVLPPGANVPAHTNKEIDWAIKWEYDLGPGKYTVAAYFCSKDEGPECLKSNTIKIDVVVDPIPPAKYPMKPKIEGPFASGIWERSTVATAKLRPFPDPVQSREAIVQYTVENFSSRELSMARYFFLEMDVRDEHGIVAPETTEGRSSHYFSPCYTGSKGAPIPGETIPAHATREGEIDLNQEYQLGAGSYTVTGYVCVLTAPGYPQCFITNTIPLNVR